jgi:hypothetical protein
MEAQTDSVWRITVDEKLGDRLFRILVARLKPGAELVVDELDCWEAEEEIVIGPDELAAAMHITEDHASVPEWQSLEEGQVYLAGAVRTAEPAAAVPRIAVTRGTTQLLRVDQFVKERVKIRYHKALRKEGHDA